MLAKRSVTRRLPKGWAVWIYLSAVLTAIPFSGCSGGPVRGDTSGPAPSRAECRDEYRELRDDISTWGSPERVKRRLISVFQSVSPGCGIRDRLFRNALSKGSGNMSFLAGLGYALYSEEFLASADEFDLWRVKVWKDDLRHKMLTEADESLSRYRSGRLSIEKYQETIDRLLSFAVWNLDNHWVERGAEDVPGMHPADILVEDLDLLSHSASTLTVYFSKYAGHEVLGNMRNFERMRARLKELFKTDAESCEIIRSLSDRGVLVLDVERPFGLQTAAVFDGADENHAPTSAPSFLHDPDSGRIDKHVIIEVPLSRYEPFRRWPGGYSYFVKPVPGNRGGEEQGDDSVFLEAKINSGKPAKVDPAALLLKPGKEKPDRPGIVNAWLKNPRKARMVGYVETSILKEKVQDCGINAPYPVFNR